MIRALFITRSGVTHDSFASLDQVSNRAIALGSELLFHRVLPGRGQSRAKKEKKMYRSFES